ncbi:MAG TPA: VWA domain-containing protein [bacterium]|nr:VWA domain-containing protein [bacterium]
MLFKDPVFLLLLVLLPLFFVARKRFVRSGTVKFSDISGLKALKRSRSRSRRYALVSLRAAALFLLIVALAGPRKGEEQSKVTSEGIDIMLVVDISGSMRAEDFILGGKRQNRLAVVKDIVKEFVTNRAADRIGMVVFSGRAFTQCPLTLDYGILTEMIDKAQIGMLDDGTAIGSAIAVAVDRLKDSPAKSKIIVLLTDGINNAGKIDPMTAAEIAKTYKIRIYTIGAGTRGLAPIPVQDFFGNMVYQQVKVDVDEEGLAQIAELTGGKFFRATDTESLRSIYAQIDKMEKTEVETKVYMEYRELFHLFLIPGLVLLVLEIVLANTVYRRLP